MLPVRPCICDEYEGDPAAEDDEVEWDSEEVEEWDLEEVEED